MVLRAGLKKLRLYVELKIYDKNRRKITGPQCINVGQDSSVVIATRYGLNDPGLEFRWGRDFTPLSRLSLGPTQPPIGIQRVPGLSRG
jgi:hypothetical protein